MIALFLHNLEILFGWLLAASWQASVLALFVLLIQRILGSRLNPRWRYALWLLVLLRLVLPVLPESALSLFQFAPPPPAALAVSVTEPLFVSAPALSPTDVRTEITEPPHPFSAYSLLAVIWLAGTVALLVVTWQVNRRFARQVANSPAIADPDLLRLFAEAKAELGIRRAIRLIESGQVQSPAIMGLFQPTLLLPADVRGKFDARELRFIFLHELAHLKRGDVIAQGLIALLQILHWFNPVLWFAFRRMRIDREPATDALVLSRTGEEEKERYGLMLIKLLEHFNQRHSLPTLVGILEDKDQFKRRFSLIARFTRGAYGWSMLGVLLIGILSVACLTKSKATETPVVSATKPAARAPEKNPAELVRVVLKVVQIDEDDYQAHRSDIDAAVQKGDVASLSDIWSFHLLAAPAVLTKSGEQGVMEVVRVLPYADKFEKDASGKMNPTDFKRQNVGIRFVLLPTVTGNKINLTGDLSITSLEWWTQTGESFYRPNFHVREASVSESFASGQTKGFEVPGGSQMEPFDPTVVTVVFNPDKPLDVSKNPKALRRLFFFLTASAFSANGSPIAAALPENASPSPEKADAGTNTPDANAKTVQADNAQNPQPALKNTTEITAISEKNPANMIRLDLKVVQIDDDDYQAHRAEIDAAVLQGDAQPLLRLKSYHPVMENPVLTKAGEQRVIECVREMTFPAAPGKDSNGKTLPTEYKKRNLGVRFISFPTFSDGKINVAGHLEVTHLSGWLPRVDNYNEPAFNETLTTISDAFIPGQTRGYAVSTGAQMAYSDPIFYFTADKPPDPSQNSQAARRLFFFLTARAYSADGSPVAAALPENASPSPEKADAATNVPDANASPPIPTNGTLAQIVLALKDNAQAIPSDHQRLQILQGFYGADGSWRDVTGILQKSIQNNSLKVSWQQPYTEIGGDPAYLQVKTLIVSYRLDGVEKVATFREENPPVGLQALIPIKNEGKSSDPNAQMLTAVQKGDAAIGQGTEQDLARLKSELLAAKEDADARRVLVDSVKNLPDDQFLATLAGLGRSEPSVTALQTDIDNQNAEIANLLKDGLSADHSRIQTLRAELAVKQGHMKDLIAGIHRAMAIDNQMVDSRVALLQKEIDNLKAQAAPPSAPSR